jgi:hypothetical protein
LLAKILGDNRSLQTVYLTHPLTDGAKFLSLVSHVSLQHVNVLVLGPTFDDSSAPITRSNSNTALNHRSSPGSRTNSVGGSGSHNVSPRGDAEHHNEHIQVRLLFASFYVI